MDERETQWAELMRKAIRGDSQAYQRLLRELAPVLRGAMKRGFANARLAGEDIEDVVQEALLALHLKRHTWDEHQPLLPWVKAIARHKMIDSLRRHGRNAHIPIDDFSDTLAGEPAPAEGSALDAESLVGRLKGREREIVVAISLEGASAREVGLRLGMSEGAVRVALHRALRSLAKVLRTSAP